MSYKESSVLITGASQGIGRSIAITFAASTRRPLLLLARNQKNLEETKLLCEQAGANQVEILVCDATNMENVLNLMLDSYSFMVSGVQYLIRVLSSIMQGVISINRFLKLQMKNFGIRWRQIFLQPSTL